MSPGRRKDGLTMNNSTAEIQPDALIQSIDVLEESIRSVDKKLLDILLSDRTTHKNILWATKDYENLGLGFEENSQILPHHRFMGKSDTATNHQIALCTGRSHTG